MTEYFLYAIVASHPKKREMYRCENIVLVTATRTGIGGDDDHS